MEYLAILEKVFFSSGYFNIGGSYELTFVDIETGERKIVKTKLKVKEEFLVNHIYRVEIREYDDTPINLVLMYDSIADYVRKNVSAHSYNYIRNKKQFLAQGYYYLAFALVVTIFFYFIKLIMNMF